jgi:rod shape determining protein RodA
MFDKQYLQNFNWGLLGLVLLLCGIGLATLYSTVSAGALDPNKTLYFKQLTWFCAAFILMLASLFFNYRMLDQWAPVIYGLCIGLLVWVFLFGKYAGGSRRWLQFGSITLQPSEMVKLALVISLARYYSKLGAARGVTLKELITPLVLTTIPFLLIVKQPDLGTALILVLIAGSITVFVKIERRTLVYTIVSCIITVPLVWFFLKNYQKQRILTFINPDRDPLGAGYHIIQSKIAIGSGMITGKGFLKGTQNALSFLPEQHTDFIFSVLAEEWGFFGSAILIICFFILIAWGLNIANNCRDTFGTILSLGVTSMLFWQVFINIGMVMGLMPVVGAPLPFISYGGSSIMTTMIGVGVLLNISMRRTG